MRLGRTTDGQTVEILKRSTSAVLVRVLADDQLRYVPHATIATDGETEADAGAAPLHVQVARAVAHAGFLTPQALIETTGRCESDLTAVTDHLVRTGVLQRRRVGGVVGYEPADGPT
ncbi:MAG: hypothetical protein RI544_05135 [Haloquadratum sp.]|jgi:hypothetical protein|nr:hypothetical protein [Haloferacaceae archaeon]MDR9445525.1 hypothetical protein [Haloquadratum sp.]